MVMKYKKSKKGQFGFDAIPGAVVSLGIAVFSLALIITLVATFGTTLVSQNSGNTNCTVGSVTDVNGCGAAYNATAAGITGLAEYNNWWVILVISSVFLIIFGLLAVIRSRTSSI